MAAFGENSHEFIDLFLKAEPRVYAYIRSQIPHRADAEDVLQETATTLWSKFDEFQRGSDFIAWAYQVARFKVQHHYEKKARRKRLFSEEFVHLVELRSKELSGNFDALQVMLAECMKRLGEADREVIQLCYGDDATIASVAEQLGRPVNTIKSVLKRGRRALYDCIQRAMSREDRP
jgi:RNA polymerase sigma-70 factor, ECF subfamily